MGSAERGLLLKGRHYSLAVRLLVVGAASLVSLVLGHGDLPTGIAVLVLNAWNVCYAVVLLRGSAGWLVWADVLVMSGVCLTHGWTTSPAPSSGPDWVIVAVEITLIAFPWQRGTSATATGTVAIMAAYFAGAALVGQDGVALSQLWTFVEVVLSWCLYRFVRRGAVAADRQVERAERSRRVSAVAAARRADEREYLAALHDTASATLLMVGTGVVRGRERWLADQARRDLEVLSEPAAVSGDEVDLVALLRETARHTPLRVSFHGLATLRMPAVGAVLLRHGTREALTNVVRHADTDAAEIHIHRAGDEITVGIADQGSGFDPARVTGHHYGVTRSMVERMARVNGSAQVTSAPGKGTRVLLTYPVSTSDSTPKDVKLIATSFERGLRWAVVLICLVSLLSLDLPYLLYNLDVFRAAWPQFLAMGGFFAVSVVAAVSLWRNRPLDRWRWPLVVLVLALSILATESVPPEHRLGPAHWSEGNAGWFVVLLLLDSRIGVLVTVLVTQYVTTFLQTALGGAAALSVIGAVNSTWVVLASQLTVSVIAVVLRGLAVSSARAAHVDETLRTTEAVAAQLHEDRKDRYADLTEVLPLLGGLASGALDPGEEPVRQACAVEAAKMRRLFAEDAAVPDPLLHELSACIELAERNGISVSFVEFGVRPAIPTQVRRRLTAPASAALVTAREKVRLTVAGADGAVTVSVVADCPPNAVQVHNSDGVRTSTVVDGDRLWIKATWRGTS